MSDLDPCGDARPRTPSRVRRILPWVGGVLLIALVYTAIYWTIVSHPRSYRIMKLGDSWGQFLPWQAFLDNRIHHGEFPLWYPLTFCGRPFAADPQCLAFHPLNLLRSALTFAPTPYRTQVGWIILDFLQFEAAALGMFVLARRHRLSGAAAAVAALGFTCSASYTAFSLSLEHYSTNFAWLPWLLVLLDKALALHANRRQRSRYAVAAGLVYGLLLLGGHPVFMVYNTLFAGAYVAFNAGFPRRTQDTTPDGIPPFRIRFIRGAAVLGLCLGPGILLGAAPILSTAQFASLSIRSSHVVDPIKEAILRLHDPFRETIERFFVYPRSPLTNHITLSGACVSLLALCAILHRDRRSTLFYALLFYGMLDVLLGPPMPIATVLGASVPYGIARTESYFTVPLIGLPVAMLAGFGLDAIARTGRTRMSKVVITTGIIAAGALALESIARWTGQISTVKDVPWFAPAHAFLFFTMAPATMIVTLIAMLWSTKVSRWMMLLPALAFMDILLWNSIVMNTEFNGPHHIFAYHFPFEGMCQPKTLWSSNHRIGRTLWNPPMLNLEGIINGYNPIYIGKTGKTLCAPEDESTYFRVLGPEIASTNLRWYQILKRQFWLSRQIVAGPLPPKDHLFPAATTTFLLHPPANSPVPVIPRESLSKSAISPEVAETALLGQPELAALKPTPGEDRSGAFTLTYRLPTIHLGPRHSALRLALIGTCEGEAEVTARDPLSKDRLYLRRFPVHPNPATPIRIEIPLPDLPTLADTALVVTTTPHAAPPRLTEAVIQSDRADEGAMIHILYRRANSVEVAVDDLPKSRVLTFVDSAYPGWKAYVDSEPVPIYDADDAFKAIILPPGRHIVRFVFSPTRVYIGVLISVSTMLGALIYLVRNRGTAIQPQKRAVP